MIRFLDVVVVRARKERGLSQKALISELGEHNVSLRTLRRIEQGNTSVRLDFVKVVLDYFGIDLSLQLKDAFEEKIAREHILPEDEDSGSEIADVISEVNDSILEYRSLFHGEKRWIHNFPITNVAELLIFLPLFSERKLYDSLLRISGNICGNFYYVMQQLEWLYNEIPDKNLRRIGDEYAKRVFEPDYVISAEDMSNYRNYLEKKAEICEELRNVFETAVAIASKANS